MRNAAFALTVFILSALACAGRVGVLVQYDDSSHEVACVNVGDGATAGDALAATGLAIASYEDPTYGTGLCGISGVGCPASQCWCDPMNFWGFYHKQAGAFQMASVGMSSFEVGEGMVVGFRWGGFGSSIAEISFDDACPPERHLRKNGEGVNESAPKLVLKISGNYSGEGVANGTRIAVTGTDGKPVPFARVRVLAVGGPFKYEKALDCEGDGEGNAVVELASGSYLVQALLQYYQPAEVFFEVSRDEEEPESGEAAALHEEVALAEEFDEDGTIGFGGIAAGGFALARTGWMDTGWVFLPQYIAR